MRTGISLALLMSIVLAPGVAAAGVYNSADRTDEIEIVSARLGETRRVFVRTPPNYDPAAQRYPVVYALDGEWNFELVAAYLDYMAEKQVYPPIIVAGVENVNRNRDYVPGADPNFTDTGRAGDFLAFVSEELIPQMEAAYPTSGARILIGHSFGGVFTLHALFKKPELFDAYIALGASAWIADRVLFEEAAAFFDGAGDTNAFVYMAVGEGDGGPTLPSSRDLAALFEERAPSGLEWTFDVTPRTEHFKNFASGMHDAFMALFPAWEFEDDVAARARAEGAAGVDAWFAEKEAELGFRFAPAWFDLGVAAIVLSAEGHGDAARALTARLKAYYPDNPNVASFDGNVHENLGLLDDAEAAYRRALRLVDERGLHPNEMHRSRVETAIARVLEKKTAAE